MSNMDVKLEQLQMAFLLGRFGFRSGKTLDNAPYDQMSSEVALYNSWRRGYMTELSTIVLEEQPDKRTKCPKCCQDNVFTFILNAKDVCLSSWMCQVCFYSDLSYGAINIRENGYERRSGHV